MNFANAIEALQWAVKNPGKGVRPAYRTNDKWGIQIRILDDLSRMSIPFNWVIRNDNREVLPWQTVEDTE